mmetsp:Transcript_639/g.1309  ORF Transcript_639/g.1309 Transcript_639/m.1309 type:complete len:507 (+) Transcript_639:32-1552(+)
MSFPSFDPPRRGPVSRPVLGNVLAVTAIVTLAVVVRPGPAVGGDVLYKRPSIKTPTEAPMFRSLEKLGPTRVEQLPQDLLQNPMKPVKAAEMFRSVETVRRKRMGNVTFTPRGVAKHPFPEIDPEEGIAAEIPGGVERDTKREKELKMKLRKGPPPTREEFSKLIAVFATWAKDKVRWLPVQQRLFSMRSRKWLIEMLQQGHNPSDKLLLIVLEGCASAGDVMGAQYWFNWMVRQGRQTGRAEFNAVIGACGEDGWPVEARAWMRRMQREGFPPDAKSYAGLVAAWERSGNRARMLSVLLEMQDAQAAGLLGEPLKPEDAILPYLPLARSYAEVADAPRAISVLKHVKDQGHPLTPEVHVIRLEALLRTPERRLDREQVLMAFRDAVIAAKQQDKPKPIMDRRLAKLLDQKLGKVEVEAVLKSEGAQWKELVAELPPDTEVARYKRIKMKEALADESKIGVDLIQKIKRDAMWAFKRSKSRTAKMGQVAVGSRDARDGALPEWMTV